MKNPKPRDLEVVPLKKYREPRYPVAGDFDMAVLRGQPYPFSSRFRSWATTIGASSLICSLVSGEEPAGDGTGNPFSVAKSGLPFRSSPFGTGQPSYLSQEIAREIIDRIFAEKGFKLQQDFVYRKDDIAFKATGFDAKARVGYVWADWNSLDPADAIIHWIDEQFSKKSIEQLIDTDQGEPAKLEASAGYLVQVMEERYQGGQFKAEVEKATSIKSLPDRLRALADIFEKAKATESEEKVSLREMKSLEAGDGKDRDFVAVISQRQFEYQEYPTTPELQKKFEAARLIKDDAERAKAYQELQKEAASETLKRLEGSVRDYLEWARGQGLQN